MKGESALDDCGITWSDPDDALMTTMALLSVMVPLEILTVQALLGLITPLEMFTVQAELGEIIPLEILTVHAELGEIIPVEILTVQAELGETMPLEIPIALLSVMVPLVTTIGPVVRVWTTPDDAEMIVGLLLSVTVPLERLRIVLLTAVSNPPLVVTGAISDVAPPPTA